MSRQIPFADLKSQYNAYKAELDKAVLDVMGSSMYIMGPEVEKLEKNLAAYVGARHALSVSSGTDALLLALMSYGIKAGDEVITTPFTFIATAEVIALVGAKPVFADMQGASIAGIPIISSISCFTSSGLAFGMSTLFITGTISKLSSKAKYTFAKVCASTP